MRVFIVHSLLDAIGCGFLGVLCAYFNLHGKAVAAVSIILLARSGGALNHLALRFFLCYD
jgi:hypothetical protein